MIEEKIDPSIRLFQRDLRRFTKQVSEASHADVKGVQDDELAQLDEALDDFKQRHAKAKARAVA